MDRFLIDKKKIWVSISLFYFLKYLIFLVSYTVVFDGFWEKGNGIS